MGTSVVLLGPAGCGKSTLAIQYVVASAGRGERAAIFAFDERVETLLENGRLVWGWTSPSRSNRAISPFIRLTRPNCRQGSSRIGSAGPPRQKEAEDGAKLVVIDSLNGYMNAMPEERFLTAQLHELLTYLGHKGVVTFLIVAQHGLVGHMESPIDTTYLADTVILFQLF